VLHSPVTATGGITIKKLPDSGPSDVEDKLKHCRSTSSMIRARTAEHPDGRLPADKNVAEALPSPSFVAARGRHVAPPYVT
jgi:hypothetical protein